MSQSFIVQSPLTESGVIIFGRNSLKNEICNEVLYFDRKGEASEKFDGTVNYSIILSRSEPGSFGGNVGSNSGNVCISVEHCDNDSGNLAYDLVRVVLERSGSCVEAIEVIKEIIAKHSSEGLSVNFLVCDKNEGFSVNVSNKEVISEKITDPFKSLSGTEWPVEAPVEGFNVTSMFEVLRKAASADAKSSFVMVMNPSGLSTQWFTATPNPNESVYKPFIFTPSARISPLTQKSDDSETTLLMKLHSNRKWDLVGNLLQSLETTCVEEVNKYINDNPILEEFDELFKDCTEAEVKFYR